MAVIDSGIDYAHPDFCNSDGTTRIAVLWDQTLDTVYERETINLALRQESEQERYAICPSRMHPGMVRMLQALRQEMAGLPMGGTVAWHMRVN